MKCLIGFLLGFIAHALCAMAKDEWRDGMIFNIGGGVNAKGLMPAFTYTGRYQLIDDGKANGVQNWRIKLLSSGVLTFTRVVEKLDVFLVGGGGGGSSDYRGGGGGGGYTRTSRGVNVKRQQTYSVTIGNGGRAQTDGGTSSAFGLSASGGKGSKTEVNNAWQGGAGGSGGGGGAEYGAGAGGSNGSSGGKGSDEYDEEDGGSVGASGGSGQGTTTREFGEYTGTLYAGGGGGGGRGSSGFSGYGGAGGGGNGYNNSNENAPIAAQNGSPNTGGGGGGGYNSAAGQGGSGIVVIRNAR